MDPVVFRCVLASSSRLCAVGLDHFKCFGTNSEALCATLHVSQMWLVLRPCVVEEVLNNYQALCATTMRPFAPKSFINYNTKVCGILPGMSGQPRSAPLSKKVANPPNSDSL